MSPTAPREAAKSLAPGAPVGDSSAPMTQSTHQAVTPVDVARTPVPVLRSLAGGVLMGLANLVPGISGGTMILAIGLYERFIASLADVSRLRLRWNSLLFLGLVLSGLVLSVVTLAGVAVALVTEQRWIMYSLFIGMTLGGAPELWRQCRPLAPAVLVAFAAGLGAMVVFALELSGTQLPRELWVFVLAGAVASASMILPGISGSYVLLILGLYDVVVSSASSSALREDPRAALAVLVPVVIGAGLGMASLSNLLKALLGRFPRASHGALLGLLVGSVLGLYPFQEPVHPDLAEKRVRKATEMVLAGEDFEAVRAAHGEDLDDARLAALAERWRGLGAGDLKARGEELRRFEPAAGQIAGALGLALVGALLTRLLGRRPRTGSGE